MIIRKNKQSKSANLLNVTISNKNPLKNLQHPDDNEQVDGEDSADNGSEAGIRPTVKLDVYTRRTR